MDGYDFSGQVALVTGGGRGLGRAMALALAEAGAVVAVVARSQEEIDETAAQIVQCGGKALALKADVGDWSAVEAMARQVEQELGTVDLLINNAGVVNVPAPLWEAEIDDWLRVVNINLNGPFLCIRAILPSMIGRGRGRIINVSSSAGAWPVPFGASYSASKTGLARLSECLALETKDHGISVFAIDPGFVLTAMLRYLVESEEGQKYVPQARESVLAGYAHSPKLTSDLVLWLASGQADALSGRFFSPFENRDELVQSTEKVVNSDLYTLRLGKLPSQQ